MRLRAIIIALLFCAGTLCADNFADGKTAFSANKPADAIPLFELALQEQNPNPELYNYLGLAYYQTGGLAKSLEIFTRGLNARGTNKRILAFNAGNTAFALGDYQKADELYTLALAAAPEFADAALNRAGARLELRLWDDSAAEYERYLELAPETPQRQTIEDLIARLRAQAAEERALAEQAALEEQRLAALKAADEERRLELMREIAARLKARRGNIEPAPPKIPAPQ
jgi:tetratricopeptide (TPR) repeat protein